MRNGLAIAGMAGGIFFLGQAVASADQVSDAANGVDQSNSSTESDGGNANLNGSSAEATNVDKTEVDTDVDGGDGGTNNATVNTGVVPIYSTNTFSGSENEEEFTSIEFDSGDVKLTQEANGGDVNGSGNVAVAGGGDQTAIATNEVDQSNTSESDDHDWNGGGGNWDKEDGPEALSSGSGGGHDEDGNANLNGSSAEATNIHKVEVDTDIDGGDGGTNNADINTGIIGNTFYCPEYSTCIYNFRTGSVTLVQEANGGDVNGSGNVNVGGNGQWPWCDCDKDGHQDAKPGDCPQKHEEARPAVKPVAPAAPVAHQAPASAKAQPSGQLAYTGSDVSLPLTVGLLALGLGVGLTAAGRRRETQTV
ncbi:hypothetical protein [Blastococcus sp. CT_GayMR16]|uniref:hypothetical protein n=1 Tax=Blastococcus sp. CT_GayMR16 TaxID=2559607 RepID=UPI001073F3C4|nr:hypothetical protein [Blastococcus sp. CT_GayMR16]TFV85749.1 hypothetical protein E4P38_19450 [Blastococcus sp. CT_GayMR16]